MSREISTTTNPLDLIRAGFFFQVPEGQLVMKGPIVIEKDGVLLVDKDAHLILEG